MKVGGDTNHNLHTDPKTPGLYETPEPDEEAQVCFITAAQIATAPTGWAVQWAVGVDVPFRYNLGHLLFTLCCPRQYLTMTHLPLPLHRREHRDGANTGEKEPKMKGWRYLCQRETSASLCKRWRIQQKRTSEEHHSQGKTKDYHRVFVFNTLKMQLQFRNDGPYICLPLSSTQLPGALITRQVLIKLYKSLVRVTRNIIMEGFKLFMHTNKTQRTDYRLLKIWIIQRFA